MTFINTNGMAFIGPGSEWFWTTISGLVLVVTVIAIYRQLRLQRMQLQENTKVLRSQAHYNALVLVQRPWELILEYPDLSDLVAIGSATPDKLSPTQWARFNAYSFMQFNGWEYFYYQHREDAIPAQLWTGADVTFKGMIHTMPGLARFWTESRASFDEPFRSYVDHEFAAAAPVHPGPPTPG